MGSAVGSGLSEVDDAAELLVGRLSAGGSVAGEPGVSIEVLSSRRICASVGVASAGCVSAGAAVVVVVVVVTLGSAASSDAGA